MNIFGNQALLTKSAKRKSAALRAAIEPLEGRVLLTSVVVNSISDTATGAGLVTLRDAIGIANGSATPTTITFDPTVFAAPQTIVLNGTQLELSNTKEPITITGPSAGVTISGNAQSTVFQVDTGVTASLAGLNVIDGQNYDTDYYSGGGGGGVNNFGNLTLNRVNVTGNNSAGWGGGIWNSGTVTIENSTLSGNTANQGGGGIHNHYGTATLIGVTLSNNTNHHATTGAGSAIDNSGSSVLTLTNVTVVNNSDVGNVGAVWSDPSARATLASVTISSNSGGGLVFTTAASAFKISDSIVAGNSVSGGSGPEDVKGALTSLGHNLIGATDGSTGWISSDLTGTIASPKNADLGPLANNGGLTQTMLPLAGSPAIGTGSIALIPAGITTDQRGLPRTVNGRVDIGAVEVQSAVAASTVVNTVSDGIFPPGSGKVSLRNAIATADSSATPTTITFDPTVFATPQTIVLNGTQLELSNTKEPITITGPSAGVTISGNNESRVLEIDSGVTAGISRVSVTKGSVSNAAGIDNWGTLTLTDATISDNTASFANAGLRNGGVATLVDVTLTGNVAAGTAAIVNGAGATLTMTNGTITRNSATNDGLGSGGIENFGNATLTNVTIAGNSSAYYGGGISVAAGATTTLANTIVAGNSALGGGPDVYGAIKSLGYNLVGIADGSSGFDGLDLTGTAAKPLNAKLGPLGNNGGLTQTMLLLAGSPAIGHGSVARVPGGITTDQRGLPRIVNGSVDIGAVETQSSLAAPTITTSPSNQSVIAGATATFAAAASGNPTPTVQWRVSTNNGASYSPISGATSATYAFAAGASQTGDFYEAVFTNSQGTAATTPATLTVTPMSSGIITLASFNGADGANSYGGVILSGGALYGTTLDGGAENEGEAFSLPLAGGTPTVLASFDFLNGYHPAAGLAVSGGTLYGMTNQGGANNLGEVFSVSEAGITPTVLASFNGADGSSPQPEAGLAVVGNTLYGATGIGGNVSLNGGLGYGEVFSLPATGGTPTVLASFDGPDGSFPEANLTVVGNTLYGTTSEGGANGDGEVFSLRITGGTPTVLTSFNGANGKTPVGGLILSGNMLYGTTSDGGANNDGEVFSLPITGGAPTVLASFDGANGKTPYDGVLLSGSVLYGTTAVGGAQGDGAVFSLPLTGGTPTVLASFNGANGIGPYGGLMLFGNALYGTTWDGGANGDGTVFELTITTAASIVATPPPAQTTAAGKSQSFTLGSFTQSDAKAPFKATVQWGDGSANSTVNVAVAGTIPATAHTFAKTGTYTVTVRIADSASHESNTATFKVTVAAAAKAIEVVENAIGIATVDADGSDASIVADGNGSGSLIDLSAETYVTTAAVPADGALKVTLTAGEESVGSLFGEKEIA